MLEICQSFKKKTTTENPELQANRFNKFYTSVGEIAAAKTKALAERYCLHTQNLDPFPCPASNIAVDYERVEFNF